MKFILSFLVSTIIALSGTTPLRAGMDFEDYRNMLTPYERAFWDCDLPAVEKHFSKYGSFGNKNLPTNDESVLHYAVERGCVPIVRFLLENGYDKYVNYSKPARKRQQGPTTPAIHPPLIMVSSNISPSILAMTKLLLEYGAEANSKSLAYGKYALA